MQSPSSFGGIVVTPGTKETLMQQNCFICRKNVGLEAAPPGGYIIEDMYWKVGHGPAHTSRLGTLVIEAARHYLDFADMTSDEATSYGPLLVKLYAALKAETGAERVYTALFMEGAPHFHTWLVPRFVEEQVRGPALLAEETPCNGVAAARLAGALRERLLQ
jgi:diadenosine tetraphosphate (Ap4A) HIT family hydrolase